MAIKTENLYRKLFNNLNSQGYNPSPKSAQTGKDTVPEEADYLEFDFDTGAGIIPVSVSVEKINDRFHLVVYMDDSAYKKGDITELLPKLRYTAQNSGIGGFTVKNRDHLQHDQQKRMYMKKQEQIKEGYYPMGRKASYNDAVPSVKIILQHTRQIEEGEQRYRNIARIFLENEQGERFLAPTVKPGVARVYARHIAEGGLPNDDRWNHIKGLCEEYTKMAGFVRATRNGQFNESTQKLIAEGINHYQNLRETLSRMAGHRGYNAYFESYTPNLMEDDTDTSNLNELFVQETVDPRIESALPILSRLQKKISEMSEVNELAEWADKLIEDDSDIDADEAEDSADNAEEDLQEASDEYSIPEEELDEAKPGLWANIHAKRERIKKGSGERMRKPGSKGAPSAQDFKDAAKEGIEQEGVVGTLKKVGKKVADVLGGPDDAELLRRLQKSAGIPQHAQHGKPNMATPNKKLKEMPDTQFHEEENDPGNLGDATATLVNELSEEGVEEALNLKDLRAAAASVKPQEKEIVKKPDIHNKPTGDQKSGKTKSGELDLNALRDIFKEEEVEESGLQAYLGNKKYGKEGMDALRKAGREHAGKEKMAQIRAKYDKLDEIEMAEDLDANQKRVGQLGPYEKVGPKGAVGKLVGSESVEPKGNSITEMDKSQPSSDRGGESSGDPYAKGGKGTPAKAKDVAKDAEKTLDKAMDKAHKKEVKEGQEDFDYMMKLLGK